jgi:hypothetical protein
LCMTEHLVRRAGYMSPDPLSCITWRKLMQ